MGGQADDAPFVSGNVSHGAFDGVHEALTLERRETFAGLLGDTEIVATFDETGDTFIGRVRNEASEAVCDVQVAVVLDPGMGSETALEVPQIAGLRVGERGSFELQAGGEGSEGGGESGEEANPSIPIDRPYAGENAGQTSDFAYDTGTGLFQGTVENTSTGLICDSRTEIHLGAALGVVELGPTIPEHLAPGDVLYVVMYQDGPEPHTYILHPEASPCP